MSIKNEAGGRKVKKLSNFSNHFIFFNLLILKIDWKLDFSFTNLISFGTFSILQNWNQLYFGHLDTGWVHLLIALSEGNL